MYENRVLNRRKKQPVVRIRIGLHISLAVFRAVALVNRKAAIFP